VRGQTAVVPGATKGVGGGISRELARLGARVFITGRTLVDESPRDDGTRECDNEADARRVAANMRGDLLRTDWTERRARGMRDEEMLLLKLKWRLIPFGPLETWRAF
jgi:NAD(P)-dependent dehydrogenase (short-subunit alcohol dehydrogenase family)